MQWTVTSPDGNATVGIEVDHDGRLWWNLTRHGRQLISPSRWGLICADQSFDDGLEVDAELPIRLRDDTAALVHGTAATARRRANEVTVTARGAAGAPLEIDLSVGDDAVAFRYRLPQRPDGAGTATVTEELTTFAFAGDGRTWMQSTVPVSAPAHENYYANGVPIGTASDTSSWDMPALFEIQDQWLLLAESDLRHGFHGSRLGGFPQQLAYTVVGPDPTEGLGASITPAPAPLPLVMPWRVLALADEAVDLLQSQAVWSLAEPSQVSDTGWITPGRAAWSWWSDNASSTDEQAQRRFIDFAALMGWEYSLVDANWNTMGDQVIQDLVEYGRQRHVKLMLWYNSGGPNNAVTEEPRDLMHVAGARRAEFARIAAWGIAGVKVDFFESDKAEHIALMLDIAADAADARLLVNFHGCTVPRGWQRTWPNVMTLEAVKGAEWYLGHDDFAARAPVHNTILPFTRNLVGPMDYTPATFSDRRGPRVTSTAHELALTVVFASSLLHLADAPESYVSQHPAVVDMLRAVPVTWDETVGVAGRPGDHVIVARRHRDHWWIAGICGDDATTSSVVPMSTLGRDKNTRGRWTIIADGATRDEVRVTHADPGPMLVVPGMRAGGGFVARWEP